MKNLISLLMLAIMLSSLSAQRVQNMQKLDKRSSTQQKEEIFTLPGHETTNLSLEKRRSSKAQKSIWRPEKTVLLVFERGEWMELVSIQSTFDKQGNILTDDDGESLYTYTYDENNNKTSVIEQAHTSEGLVNVSKKTYQYDTYVKDLIIDQQYYLADPATGEWQAPYYHHKREIIRDNKGNILSVTVLLKGVDNTFLPIEKVEVTYDEMIGIAKTIKYSQINEESVMLEIDRLENIKWESTDGQIQGSMYDLIQGNNRLKEAKYYYEGEEYGSIKCLYNTENPKSPNFELTIAASDNSEVEYRKLTETDNYGSYKEILQMKLNDEYVGNEYIVVIVNEFGHFTEEAYYSNMDTPDEMIDGIKQDFVYHTDADKVGIPTQMTVSMFDYEVGEYFEVEREVYSDFINIILSIQSNAQTSDLNCYVQNSNLHFSLHNKAQYAVFSLSGALIQRGVLASGNHSLPMNASKSGIYVLYVNDGVNSVATKFFRP